MTVGDRIRDARLKAKLTQQEVADRLGVKVPSYQQYETGKRTGKIATLQRIADALGVDLSDLYEDAPPRMPVLEVVQAPEADPDPQRAELMSNYDQLNDEGRNALVNTSRGLVACGQYKKEGLA